VRRRDFIAVFGGAAAWPLAGRAQQSEEVRRLGVLLPYPESDPVTRAILTAFTDALARLRWVVSKNIRIDYRFAAGDPTLYKIYAAELVGLSLDAIFAGELFDHASQCHHRRSGSSQFAFNRRHRCGC
jgi:putative tryptophan/tyrosine transport system substrate-binding protein